MKLKSRIDLMSLNILNHYKLDQNPERQKTIQIITAWTISTRNDDFKTGSICC
jgi:hypothetical protein